MPRKKKECSELKKRAQLAKKRMRMGYWKTLTDEKVQMLDEMGFNFTTMQFVKNLQYAKLERDAKKIFDGNQALKEEIFYQKVCEILKKDEFIMNPIGQLVDHDEYDVLDDENKQRYILELSKKFRQMRERFEKERLTRGIGG